MTDTENGPSLSSSQMFTEEIGVTFGIWLIGTAVSYLLGDWLGVVIAITALFFGGFMGPRLPPRIHGVSKAEWERAKEIANDAKARRDANREYCRRARKLHETLVENEEYYDDSNKYTGSEWIIEVKKR